MPCPKITCGANNEPGNPCSDHDCPQAAVRAPHVSKARYDDLRRVAESLASALERADALNSNAEYWGKQMNGVGQTYRDRSIYALHCFRNGNF